MSSKTGLFSFRGVIQAIIRFLVPKDDRFYGWFEQMSQLTCDAAASLESLPSRTVAEVYAEVSDIEHRADGIVHEVEAALAETFVTPLDREDLQKLAHEMDDVLDYIKAVLESCYMRGVDEMSEPMRNMVTLITNASCGLKEAVSQLRCHRYDLLQTAAIKVCEAERQGDEIKKQAIFTLYHGGTTDAIRLRAEEKTILALEAALNSAEALAKSLKNLAVKHG